MPVPPLPSAVPVAAAERVSGLDAVRGFALLGILLMNIEAFNGPLWLSGAGVDPRWDGMDRWLDTFIYVVVQGSFFPLFSLLFGIGFALMGQRLTARGVSFTPIHLRRMVVLAVIGLLHAVLVWSGDVLLMYALLGCLLPALDRLSPRWLAASGVLGIAASAGVILLMAGLFALMALSPEAAAGLAPAMEEVKADVAAQIQMYGDGTYLQAVLRRIQDLAASVQALVVTGGQVLGLFLIGAALVRSGALADRTGHARLWAALRWLAWPLGLALSVLGWQVSAFNPPWELNGTAMLAQAIKTVAGSLMGLGWLAWGLHAQRLLAVLAPAGRMSLTTYLGQSLVCTGVFYGYGLGWFGQLSRTEEVVFVLCLYAAQVLFAHLWLKAFLQGPVEWLWRMGTYGKVVALRR